MSKPTEVESARSERAVDEIMDEAQSRFEAENVIAADVIIKLITVAADQAKGTINVDAFTKAAVAAIGYVNQDSLVEGDETTDDEASKLWIERCTTRSRAISGGLKHTARINAAINNLPIGAVVTTMVRAAFELAVEEGEKELDEFREMVGGISAILPPKKPTAH